MNADIHPPLRHWPGRRMRQSKAEKLYRPDTATHQDIHAESDGKTHHIDC